MERIRKDFSTRTLVMIPIAIALNVAIGTLIYNLKLPIYLDSIGTILVGILAGPWAGALTGLLANIVGGMIANYPQLTAYAGVAAAIGLMSGLFAETGWLKKWWRLIVVGLINGVISAILSAPVTAFLFNGVLGNASTDAIIAFFQSLGWDVFYSSLGQGLVVDPLDKAVTFLIVWAVLTRLPKRFAAGFPRSENVIDASGTPVLTPAAGPGAVTPAQAPSVAAPVQPEMSGTAPVSEAPARKTPTAKKSAAKKPAAATKPAAKKSSGGKAPAKPKAKSSTRK